MSIHSVYIESAEEVKAPPSQLLQLTYFEGGTAVSGEEMEPLIFIAIGEYEEGFDYANFKVSEQFTIRPRDLIDALMALGVDPS